MRHTGRIILIAAPLVVLIIAGVLLFVSLAPRLHARWTNDASISAPRSPSPRGVLWEPARALELAGNDSGDEYEPRSSPDGTILAFVRRRAGANADLFLSRLQPDASWSSPQPIASINTPADELGPEFSPDGRSLYFYSDRPGGLGGYDIWSAARDGDSFTAPTNLGPAVNTEFNEYAPAWLPDASRLYFASNRPKPGEMRPDSPAWSATLREQHARHDYDLYSTELRDRSFAPAAILESLRTDFDEGSPAVSPAGDFLYFASDRPGGLGGFDLYRSRLRHSLPLAPENLGAAINSPRNELDPGLSAHGFVLVFSSDRSTASPVPSDSTLDPAAPLATYSIFQSISREVYLADAENTSARLLARIWQDAWPWLALLAMFAALLWLFARLWKSELFRRRIAQLSLLAKCVLASAVIHTLLAMLFAVWHVSQHVGELLQAPGGSRIIVSAGASPDALTSQVRAGLAIDSPPTALPDVAFVGPPPVPLHNPTFVPAAPDAVGGADRVPLSFDNIPQSRRTPTLEPHSITPVTPASEPVAASIPIVPPPPLPSAEPSPSSSASIPQRDRPTPLPIAAGPVRPMPQMPSRLETPAPSPPRALAFDAAATDARASSSPAPSALVLPDQPDVRESPEFSIPTPTAAVTSSSEPALTVNATPLEAFARPHEISVPSYSQSSSNGPSSPPPLQDSSPMPTERMATVEPFAPRRSSDTSSESLRFDLTTGPSEASDAAFAGRIPNATSPPAPTAAPTEEPLSNVAVSSSRALDFPTSAPSLTTLPPSPESLPTRPTPLSITAPTKSQVYAAPAQSTRRSGSTVDAPAPTGSSRRAEEPVLSFEARLPEIPAEASKALTPAETFDQRTPEIRGEVLRQTGGTPEGERAVQRALVWLAKHQESDGHWGTRSFDATCHCGGRGEVEADSAMTGLALLCFLGAGHTHLDPGPHTQTVAKALAWLTSRQSPSGDLRRGETMYGQTVACVALCEAFAMTQDQTLASPARRAFEFILTQSSRTDTTTLDTSVLGWYVMAVESARRAGVAVPATALSSTKVFLASAASPSAPGRYSPRKGGTPSPDMTAEAMFVRQLLGHARTEPAMDESARFILQTPPRWRDGAPTHYWYYATLALFQHQGDSWKHWNEAIVPELLSNQRTDANAAGSWDPQDEWSRTCGRIYQTAICTLSLEVYYRYKPAGMTPDRP